MERIYCAKCQYQHKSLTGKHYCDAKKKWIPQRHYKEGFKKCGKFKSR